MPNPQDSQPERRRLIAYHFCVDINHLNVLSFGGGCWRTNFSVNLTFLVICCPWWWPIRANDARDPFVLLSSLAFGSLSSTRLKVINGQECSGATAEATGRREPTRLVSLKSA